MAEDLDPGVKQTRPFRPLHTLLAVTTIAQLAHLIQPRASGIYTINFSHLIRMRVTVFRQSDEERKRERENKREKQYSRTETEKQPKSILTKTHRM